MELSLMEKEAGAAPEPPLCTSHAPATCRRWIHSTPTEGNSATLAEPTLHRQAPSKESLLPRSSQRTISCPEGGNQVRQGWKLPPSGAGAGLGPNKGWATL